MKDLAPWIYLGQHIKDDILHLIRNVFKMKVTVAALFPEAVDVILILFPVSLELYSYERKQEIILRPGRRIRKIYQQAKGMEYH